MDNFNLPLYETSLEEVRDIIEHEGSFQIKHLETIELRSIDAETMKMMKTSAFNISFARRLRAVLENILASHFGDSIMDDLFSRFARKALDNFGKIDRSKYSLVISLAKK